MHYTRIMDPLAFRDVARAHVVPWRRDLEMRAFGGAARHRN
jgi:hypothetical protein